MLRRIIINQCGDPVEKYQNRILPDNNNINSYESRRFSLLTNVFFQILVEIKLF